MQLKIRREQAQGITAIKFSIDVVADLTNEERELVERYKLWSTVVYSTDQSDFNAERAIDGNALALGSLIMDRLTKRRFTIRDMVQGQHIESKDLAELIGAEAQVREACRGLRAYLEAAALFDGTEQIVDIDD